MRISVILLTLGLFASCQRQTGYCESSDQCGEAQVCIAETHKCSGAALGEPLLLTINTVGRGTVTVNGQTTPCASSCGLMLPQGASARLEAKPDAGFRFAG